MDKRYERLKQLQGFSDEQKVIYKYCLDLYNKYTEGGELYHNEIDIGFDFVAPTDEAVMEDVADKFKISVEEVDSIIRAIETKIFE